MQPDENGPPNYYVRKLFSTNRGTHVVPIMLDNQKVTGKEGVYASAALEKIGQELILKMVNTTDKVVTSDFAWGE